MTHLETLNLIFVISFWVHVAGLVLVVILGLFFENDENEERFGQTFAYCVVGALASFFMVTATNVIK